MAIDPLNDPFLKPLIDEREFEKNTGIDPFFQSIGVTPPEGFYPPPEVPTADEDPASFWDKAAGMIPDLPEGVGSVRDEYMPWLTQPGMAPGSAQVTDPGITGETGVGDVGGMFKKGLLDDFYPMLQQEVAGGMIQAGGPDAVESYRERMGKARETLQNPESGTIEKTMALMALSPPGQFIRFGLDKLDEQRVDFMQSIDLDTTKEGKPAKVTLGEVLTDMGLDVTRKAQAKLQEGIPAEPTIPEEAALSMGRSLGTMSKYAVLGLTNKIQAGLISTGFGMEEFARAYADKFEETGDAQLAFQHASNSGFAEGITEAPAWKALLDKGPLKNRLLKYLALEIGGENVAELWQEFSDIATSNQDMTVVEVLDEVMERAPRIMAVTTLATAGASGTVTGGVVVAEKTAASIRAYENLKNKKRDEAMRDKARKQKAQREGAPDVEDADFTEMGTRDLATTVTSYGQRQPRPIDQKLLPDVQKKLGYQRKLTGPKPTPPPTTEEQKKLPYVPTEPEVQLNYAQSDLVDELLKDSNSMIEALEKAKRIAAAYEGYTGDPVFGDLLVKNMISGPDAAAVDTGFYKAMKEERLLYAESGQPYVWGENLDPTTFALTTGNLQGRAKRYDGLYRKAKQALARAQQNPKISNKPFESDVEIAKMRYRRAQKELLTAQIINTQGVELIEELRKKYMPQVQIMVNDMAADQPSNITKALDFDGSAGNLPFKVGGKLKGNAIVLALNARNIGATGITLNPDEQTGTFDEKELVTIIHHEFSHALARMYLENMPQAIQDALFVDYNKFREMGAKLRNDPNVTELDVKKWLYGANGIPQLRKDTRRDVLDLINVSAKELFTRWKKQREKSTHKDDRQYEVDKDTQDYFGYVMSFDEWFAHQLERASLGDPKVSKTVGKVFPRLGAVLERFHTQERGHLAQAESYSTFMQYVAAEVSYKAKSEQLVREIAEQEYAENIGLDGVMNTASKLGEPAIESLDNVINFARAKKSTRDIMDEIGDPQASLDKYNSFMKWALSFNQIMRENAHIPAFSTYMKSVQNWWGVKSQWNALATDTVKEWTNLGKQQADRLARFALAVTMKSDELGRRLTLAELEEINAQRVHRLSEDAMTVWERIDGDFQQALGYNETGPAGLYKVLLDDIKRIHANNPDAAMEAILELNKDMVQLANRNFFPLARFGRYKVLVQAKFDTVIEGRPVKKGETIIFETFEDRNERDAYAKEMDVKYNKHIVRPGTMLDTEYSFSGMPPNLIKALRDNLGLDDEQLAELDNILLEQTQAARFKKHLLKRAGVPGFSLDAMRGYASYMAHFANHIARMEHAPIMSMSIAELENTLRAIESSGLDAKTRGRQADKRAKMVQYLKRHFDYIMNPGNELAGLRSVVFLGYMGGLVKSAAVNLTQVPMITWTYLSTRPELGGSATSTGTEAMMEITKAMKDLAMSLRKGSNVITPEENEMFQVLVERAIIDESLAQELGALAEGSNLQRMLPDRYGFGVLKHKSIAKIIRDVSYYGAWMFHNVEKFNRRIAALAAFRMARKQGMNVADAIEEAHLGVDQTQYEYARWNRPMMMRGKASIIFLFKMYLQNTLYYIARNPGGKRTLLLFFLIAGMSGLPGAEDMMKIFNFLANKWNKHFGDKGARWNTEEELRMLVEQAHIDPNMFMHGLGSKYGLGPLHALELIGIPIPNVDISGSLSMGTLGIGVDALTSNDRATGVETTGKAAGEAGGAVVAVPIAWLNALGSDSTDTWKTWERAAPNAFRYMSQAIRLGTRGYETRNDGTVLETFDISDPMDLSRLVGVGLGFQDAQMAEMKRREWAKSEAFMFYETRANIIVNQEATAKFKDDREGIADAIKARKNYNDTVPFGSLKIKPVTINKAVRRLHKNQALQDRGLPKERKNYQLNQEMNELYPIEEEGVK